MSDLDLYMDAHIIYPESVGSQRYRKSRLEDVVSGLTGEQVDRRFCSMIGVMAERVNRTARNAGWWDTDRNDGEMLALMHSEISEMLEALRKPGPDKHLPQFQAIEVEAADVLIRLLDFCHARGLRLAEATIAKDAYNRNRPYKHGGKKF